MKKMKWLIPIVINIVLSPWALAEEATEPPLLDRTPVPTRSTATDEISGLFYAYTSLQSFTVEQGSSYSDDDFFKFTGNGALHTIGLMSTESSGGGGSLTFSFSDEIGYRAAGNVAASAKRYEFDFLGYSKRGEHVRRHLGFKYIQTGIEYDLGSPVNESFDATNHYVGFTMGFGGNHPLFSNSSLMTVYWSAQALGMVGWTKYHWSYQYYYYYDEPDEVETSLAGGGNGALGLQIHPTRNLTLGLGYKGQYLTTGSITESYHGWVAFAMLRIVSV